MLDTNLKTQLKAYLEKLTKPVELIATLDEGTKSAEIRTLLADIAALSDKVSFREENDRPVRKPSFLITTQAARAVRALPARRWVMNLRHWCWRYSRPVDTPLKRRRVCWIR